MDKDELKKNGLGILSEDLKPFAQEKKNCHCIRTQTWIPSSSRGISVLLSMHIKRSLFLFSLCDSCFDECCKQWMW